MTASAAPIGRMVFEKPEVQDLYHGQPLMQMRRMELLRLATANGLPTEVPLEKGRPGEMRTMTKDELVPRIDMAIKDGKIKLPAAKASPLGGLHVPDAAQAEAAIRAQLEAASVFQLRAMMPKDHPLSKKMDAKKPELIDAAMTVMAGG